MTPEEMRKKMQEAINRGDKIETSVRELMNALDEIFDELWALSETHIEEEE